MSKGRKRHPHSLNTKDQQTSQLKEQLSQALEIIQKQQKQIERLQQIVEQQQAEIEDLKRIGKRQATPFARRHWVEKPRRGSGSFHPLQCSGDLPSAFLASPRLSCPTPAVRHHSAFARCTLNKYN